MLNIVQYQTTVSTVTKLFLILACLLTCSCGVLPKPNKPHPVVLVHGIFDSGKRIGTIKRNLERQGYQCIAPSLTPNSARTGIQPLTDQLQKTINEEIKPDEKFHIVAFSMGGLVARNYLTTSDRYNDCLSLTTLATPHHGTSLAHAYPVKGGRQMRKNSAFLKNLNNNPKSKTKNMLSIRTTMDMVIIPSTSSILEGADNQTLKTFSHSSMVFSKQVRKLIFAYLKKVDDEQLATSNGPSQN